MTIGQGEPLSPSGLTRSLSPLSVLPKDSHGAEPRGFRTLSTRSPSAHREATPGPRQQLVLTDGSFSQMAAWIDSVLARRARRVELWNDKLVLPPALAAVLASADERLGCWSGTPGIRLAVASSELPLAEAARLGEL